MRRNTTLGHRFRVQAANGFSETFEVEKQLQTFEIKSQVITNAEGDTSTHRQ
jgi:hypothetical protein